MADKLFDIGDGSKVRFKDMGDGTFAEVIYIAGGGGAIGAISGVYKFDQTLMFTPSTGYTVTAGNWTRDGADIAGATTFNYKQVQADIGHAISYKPTAWSFSAPGGVTAADVPGAPTIGTATAGDGTISLAGTAPVSNGGSAITGYKGTLNDGSMATSAALPVVFSGLRNGFQYTGVVQALNAIGYGPASAESNMVTPMAGGQGLPAAPTGTPISTYTTAARSLPAGMTDNTADPFPGTTSSVTASFGSSSQPPKDIRPLDINASVIDLRNGLVSFAVKLRPSGTLANAILNLGTCYVNLYNDSNPAATKTNYMRANFGSLSINETFTGEWQIFRVPVEAFVVVGTIPDTAAYLQSVRYGGLQFVHSVNNADSFQVSVGTFTNVPKGLTKGVVVLGFDDCRRDTYAYAYPKLKAYGFPGVLYPGAINATLDKNDTSFMNTANLLEMQADGWQVASQAWDTENPSSTPAEFAATMDLMKEFYAAKGFAGGADGSYFSNVNFGSVYQSVFDSKFRTQRGFRQFNDATLPRPEPIPVSRPNFINAYGVNTASNTATNGMIPYATRAGQWKSAAIFVWHGLGTGDAKLAADGGTLTGFEKLLEWLNSAEGRALVDVVTWDEAVRRWAAGAAA